LVSASPALRWTWLHHDAAAASRYVISATVRAQRPAYHSEACARRLRGITLSPFGSCTLEVLMQRSYLLAATAAFALILQTPIALAQAQTQGTGDTATPEATTTSPTATTTTTTSPSTDSKKTTEKKPAKKKMTRRQEIDHSIETGTVPSRYRSSVPKQYQQYIPFDKR
jgi:hypothetical protein